MSLIAQYKESVIWHLVTGKYCLGGKTIKRSSSLCSTGSLWLGDIPRSWCTVRLKDLFELQRAPTLLDVPYVGLENIEPFAGRLIETDSEAGEDSSVMFVPHDILLGKLRPYLGKVLHADSVGKCSSEIFVLRPKTSFPGRFFFWCIASRPFINAVDSTTFGSKMPRANWQNVGGILLPVPPESTAFDISAFLDSFDLAMDGIQRKLKAL